MVRADVIAPRYAPRAPTIPHESAAALAARVMGFWVRKQKGLVTFWDEKTWMEKDDTIKKVSTAILTAKR